MKYSTDKNINAIESVNAKSETFGPNIADLMISADSIIPTINLNMLPMLTISSLNIFSYLFRHINASIAHTFLG